MRSLLELVQEAPLYRRGGKDIALGRRPVVVYCHRAEWPDALSSFVAANKATPAFACFHDSAPTADELGDVSVIDKSALSGRPDLLPWVFGKSERAKGIVLAQHGVMDLVFATDPVYRDARYQPDLLLSKRSELERLYAMLEDDESRMTLGSIVKQRLRGEHGFLRIARYPEYSHPRVKAEPGECVVDAGAFDGRTSLAFAVQAVNGRVFAFEPDPANQALVKKLLKDARAGSDRGKAAAAATVEIAPYALFNAETTLHFASAKKGSSAIADSAEGGITVAATSLDGFVAKNGVRRVDLVSLDVEGAEPTVLDGMRRTIERFRPKLQVSIYHRKDHLYTLPFLLESMCSNYAYFMGHHNTYSTETDIYAIPRERLGATAAPATTRSRA